MTNWSGFLKTAFVLFFAASIGHGSSIRVREDARVSTADIELGSVAEIKASDPEEERALSGLILGEAPAAGQTTQWDTEEISRRLRPYKQILKGAGIKIPSRITISREASSLTTNEFKKQIEEVLKATVPDATWEAQLADLDVPAKGPGFPKDSQVQVVPPLTRPRGPASFEVIVSKNGRAESRQWFNGRVRYFAPVAILQRQIDARTRITNEDIQWQKRDVTFEADVPASGADLPSAVARFTLQPGTILKRSQLEREMAVKFGQDVELQAASEGLAVTMQGIAQQNGFIGDAIKVKTPGTGKVLNGVIIARGIVQVQF